MKKNKLFILIIILTAIAIFSASAVCNNCSLPISSKTSESIQEIQDKSDKLQSQAEGSEYTGSGLNHNSVINSIDVSSEPAICGSTVDIMVDATDPDGDSLSYNWQIADHGSSIDNVNSDHTLFDAPSTPTQVKIVVTVTDSRGGFAEAVKLVDIVSTSQSSQDQSQDTSSSQESSSQNESEGESSQGSQGWEGGEEEPSPQTSQGWEGGESEAALHRNYIIPADINNSGYIIGGMRLVKGSNVLWVGYN